MTQRIKEIEIRVRAEDISVFFPLLAEGFAKQAAVRVSLSDLLVRQMGIDPTYLNDRVQTIFLNGRAVDDITREMVAEGDVIALSAAMPGLAGAVFRKGGMLSSMRSLPVPPSQAIAPVVRPGRVILKLFNLVARELGPDFFDGGICMDQKQILLFLKRNRFAFKNNYFDIMIDGERWGLDEVLSECAGSGEVLLFVKCV